MSVSAVPIDSCSAVTTLAVKSTFEEVMVARSKALRENKQEFAKAATDDRTIRDFIEVSDSFRLCTR